MSEPLTREPTDEEDEQAREVAMALTDALRTAPSVATGLAGLELLVIHAFVHTIKPEYVMKSFDEFATHARAQIDKARRHAHN